MTLDHDRIEELLAGYALRALSGEDAQEADRLLAEHVPTCVTCRRTLQDFFAVEGELGLGAAAAAPPDLLLPRIRHDAREGLRPRRRRTPLLWVAGAAAAAMVGVFAWSTTALNGRVSDMEDREHRIAGVVQIASDPNAESVQLQSERVASAPRLIASYVPGRLELSIVGQSVPDPAPGSVYRVWLRAADGSDVLAGEFLPEDGLVAYSFFVDLSGYVAMTITEEPTGVVGPGPSGQIRWTTTLR